MPERVEVAVVGATGFLGRSLVPALRTAGAQVATYTRSIPFLDADGRAAPGLAGAGTVFWLATGANPQTAEQQPDRVVADHTAFRGLLHAVQELTPAPTVVLLSSGGTVYDPAASPPYDESSPTRPVSAYGAGKLALEELLAREAPGRQVAVRVSNAYGPGQPVASGQGVIAHWLRAAQCGQPVRLFGDPSTTRDYVFVQDIVRALVAVAGHSSHLPPVLNVGSGRPTTLAELAETVLAVVADPSLQRLVEPARSFDVARTWLDVGLARDLLGWTPQTALPDGIAAAWDAIRRDAIPSR